MSEQPQDPPPVDEEPEEGDRVIELDSEGKPSLYIQPAKLKKVKK